MQVLAHSRDEQAELVLLEALRDGFPEVQAAAASSLARHPSDRAIAALSAVLSGPFVLRRMSLVRPAVAALGRIGRAECLPPLRALLKRRSLLRRADVRELWMLASEALASIPDPDAEQVLREEAARGPAELREVCRRALEVRRRTTQGEADGVATR
jgi:HEAT repeat protein